MSLASWAVSHRHVVWVLAIAAALFGALAYVRLPMQLFPDTSPPVVLTTTSWPGASAEDIAENLSRPLEEEFASLEGVARIESSSQDSLSMVQVEFHYGRDLDLAAVDTQNAVARIRGALPDAIGEPRVLKIDASDRPVITIGVSGDDLVAARQHADDLLAPRLQRMAGVAAVDVYGGAEKAVLVELDPAALEAYRIPLSRVVAIIASHEAALPAGTLRTEWTDTTFRVEARAKSLGDLAEIPVATPEGSRLRLGDLADIRRGSLDDEARYAVGAQRAIAVSAFKTEDANTVEVVQRIESLLDAWRASYPEMTFEIGDEDASFTEQSIANLLTNVWQALLLAAVVIFLFIGRVRLSLVAVISMPLSYGLTFALMRVTGTELNMVTLSAIILAVGMVVDASVVVLENINRRRDEGELSAKEAAVRGTDEIRLAVLAGAASTVVVLLPILFLTGFVGATFGPLARTLLFAFLSSVAVALVLVPVLTLYTGGHGRLDEAGVALARPFGALMDRLRQLYLAVLHRALRFRLLSLAVAVALFAAGVGLIRHQGMEVLPKMDGGSFFVSLETPSGSSLSETERVARDVEAILGNEPEIERVQSQVGFEPGTSSSATSGALGPTQGFITVALSPRTSRDDSLWDIQDRVRDELTKVPGIRSSTVRELGNTAKSTTEAPVVVRLSGADPQILDRLGDEVLARLAEIDGVVEPVRSWRIDQQRARLEVDALRAAQLGLAPGDVAGQVAAAVTGVDAATYAGGSGRSPPIRVRLRRDALIQPDDVLDTPIFAPASPNALPLRSVAALEEGTGQALVTRENFAPTLEITAFTRDRALSFVTADVEAMVRALDVPQGYEIVAAGEAEDLAEARAKLGGAFAISLVAVYLLLVAQLRSFVHPITIMAAVPLSLSGVGAALWLAGKPVSMPVMVGLILLLGIVVNNSILLVDFIRQAREAGAGRREAIVGSVAARFRPIMMTALSTIAGMIPLAGEWALGAERFSPLAVAVIGGLTAATFLTMIVIPILYDLFEDLGARLRRLRLPARRATATAALLFVAAGAGGERTAAAQSRVSLDLEQAVQLAREQSHELRERDHEVRAADARRKQARGRLMHRVEVKARASMLSEADPEVLELPGAEAPDLTFGDPIDQSYSARIQLTQPLFSGASLVRGYRAAELEADLARRRKAQQADDLRLTIEEVYFALYEAREMREVAERSLGLVEAHHARALRLREAGRATALDVSRASSRLAEARVALEEARGSARTAELSLVTRLGIDRNVDIVLTSDPLAAEHAMARGETLERAALAHRPELRVARTAAAVKDMRRDVLAGELWPKLSLQAGYTVANPNERYIPPVSEFRDSWDVSLVLSWTLWDGGTTYHRVKEAEHEAAASRQAVARLERFTRLEVEARRTELESALRAIEAARASVDASELALHDAERAFAAGRLPGADVLEVELELARAQAGLVRANKRARLAAAALRRLVGAPSRAAGVIW